MAPLPAVRRTRRTLLRPALAALALIAPAAAAVDSATPAQAADPVAPTIQLVGQDKVRAGSYDGYVYTDFGLSLKVSGAPLEIWSARPSYDAPVVVTQKLAGGDVTFPAGVTGHIGTLDGFVHARFVSATTGRKVNKQLAGCLGEDSYRFSPDGAFKSPYPRGCYYNPYAIGAVQGIPAGWRASVVSPYSSTPIRLKADTYDVTLRISRAYADTLGLSAADRTVTTTLVVREGSDYECRGCRTGDPGPQPPTGNTEAPTPEATEPTGDGIESAADLPPGTPLPDLRTLPAFGITLNDKGTQLRFAANVWDGGTSDMVVDGFRREGEDVMDAYQYFLDGDGNVVDYRQVGTMEWDPDPTHRHWHFTDFATYRLLDADQATTVVSGKEAFCLANTDAVDMTGNGAKWTVSYDDLGSVCGGHSSESIREVLAAGWGDTYAQYRAGQAFPIKDVPDGTYYIQVLANPEGNLIESDATNNSSLREITLGHDKHGERTLEVLPVGLVDEENQFGY